MVKLYYWEPTELTEVLAEGIMPDLGHVSLEVTNESTGAVDYVSFWPERESLIGRVTDLFKERQVRQPMSYAEESDEDGSYMQRPADQVLVLKGLDEAQISRQWHLLREAEYDILRWNCSSVIEFLLLSAMRPEDYDRVKEVVDCPQEGRPEGRDLPEIWGSLASLLDCRPGDVLRLARAYTEGGDPVFPNSMV